ESQATRLRFRLHFRRLSEKALKGAGNGFLSFQGNARLVFIFPFAGPVRGHRLGIAGGEGLAQRLESLGDRGLVGIAVVGGGIGGLGLGLRLVLRPRRHGKGYKGTREYADEKATLVQHRTSPVNYRRPKGLSGKV